MSWAQIKAQAILGAEANHVPNQEELDAAKLSLQKRRLVIRNSQLGLFLQQLSACCYNSERYDVVERSDSVDWVWEDLMSNYDIQARGAHILKIATNIFSIYPTHAINASIMESK